MSTIDSALNPPAYGILHDWVLIIM